MAKLTDKCSVYHIALPGWPESAGYIGIAADPEQRWKQHERDAHAKISPLEVHHQMREHKGEYIKEVIFEGTREQCLELEFELRPEWNMGWNTRPGGEWDERHWRMPNNWISDTLYHPDHGSIKLSKDYTLCQLAIDYMDTAMHKAVLSNVLHGNLHEFKGWRLADPLLAERVRQKCIKKLILSYFTDGNTCYKVYENGLSDFSKAIKGGGHHMNVRHVARGLRRSVNKHQACTEEEYLANPGPVFGTPEK